MRTDGSAPALRCWLARVVDLRRGDGRGLARSAAALTLIVAAHAVLETARDALLLSQFPARNLAAVYPAVALSVIPAAALVARWSARFGVRAALVAGLALAATALAALFIAGAGPGTAMGAYVLSGLVSGVLIPLYWNLCASALTPMQARRLLGVVAAAGTVGAVGGAAAALAALRVVPVPGLLLLSAAIAALAIPVLPRPATDPSTTTVAGEDVAGTGAETSPFSDPFVGRVALLVAASTAAFVVLDFFFKWTVVRTVGPARVPSFVARFYLLTSVAALVAQLVGSRALVRRLGVAWTMLVTPVLTVAGAGIAALLGGMAPAAMVLKALDGTMRGSVYRTSLELAYLPLPPATRARAKPLIDGALARVVQTIVGAGLLAGGVAGRLSATSLAFATLGLATLWLVAARALQKPYLGLLRRAIGGGALTASGRADPLDLQSAEALIAYLSHQDDFVVVGAMNALARRGRAGLISALILLRDEEAVLARALGIFAASDRQDWIARARLLLADPRDAVAMAAARALAAHHALDAADLARDQRPRLHGYAALFVADARLESDPASSPDIAAILERAGREGEQQRLGLLAAIADAPASQRLRGLLDVLAARADFAALPTTEWARAVAQQRAEALIATLISRLQRRDGRGPVRAALLSFGAAALDPLARALRDPAAPRALRVHVPNTLARFATRPAAQLQVETIESDADGLVRYKAIRALGRLVAESRLKLDRARVERLAERDLVEHFRLLGLRARLDAGPTPASPRDVARDPTRVILLGMLDDKLRQSLERSFRLLKIAHPEEDLHRVYAAFQADDKQARAHAVEFLATVLAGRRRARLRQLLQVIGEESTPEEAIDRASALSLLPPAPSEEYPRPWIEPALLRQVTAHA